MLRQGSDKRRTTTPRLQTTTLTSSGARRERQLAAALPTLGTTRAQASPPTHLRSLITQRYELPMSLTWRHSVQGARWSRRGLYFCAPFLQATSARVRPDFCVIYSFLAGIFDTNAPADNAGQVERLRAMRPVDRITTVTLCHNLARNLTSQRMWCARAPTCAFRC